MMLEAGEEKMCFLFIHILTDLKWLFGGCLSVNQLLRFASPSQTVCLGNVKLSKNGHHHSSSI